MNTISICSRLILFTYLYISIDVNSTIPFTFYITRNWDGVIPRVDIACDIYSGIVISSCVCACLVASSNTTLDNIFTTNFIRLSLTCIGTWFRDMNTILFGWYTAIFDMNAVLFGWYTTIFNMNTVSISRFNRSFNMNTIIYASYITNVNGISVDRFN